MDKKSKIALYLIVFVILMMMVAEITKPKAIIWRDSYSAADKIPLGCFVLFNELKSNLDQNLKVSDASAFDYFRLNELEERASMLFINNYLNFTKQDSEALLRFVEEGNSVLFSSLYINETIADTLNIELQRNFEFFKEPTIHKFSSPHYKRNLKTYADVIENAYIDSFDTINGTILGTYINEDENIRRVNFVKIDFGEEGGAFYIHSNPFAFSNYHMLDGNEDYTANAISFLNGEILIWDNYYKSGRKIIRSPLRFVLTNSALRWAFYLALVVLLIFVIVNGKRTQRIIPVVKPLKNETIAFTQTIGDLYFQNANYSNIIDKKIKYFLEYVRTKYYLDTHQLNQDFVKKLSLKSEKSIEECKKLVEFILYLRSKTIHTENDLKTLNTTIETFINNNN